MKAPDDHGAGDPNAVPVVLRVAAGVVVVQGAALVVGLVVYAVFLIVGDPHNRALALFGAGIGLLFGATLVLAGRGLARHKRAAYSPTVLVEIIAVPVGIGLVQGDQVLIAVAVLVPSIVVLALLLGTPAGRSVVEQGD